MLSQQTYRKIHINHSRGGVKIIRPPLQLERRHSIQSECELGNPFMSCSSHWAAFRIMPEYTPIFALRLARGKWHLVTLLSRDGSVDRTQITHIYISWTFIFQIASLVLSEHFWKITFDHLFADAPYVAAWTWPAQPSQVYRSLQLKGREMSLKRTQKVVACPISRKTEIWKKVT